MKKILDKLKEIFECYPQFKNDDYLIGGCCLTWKELYQLYEFANYNWKEIYNGLGERDDCNNS